MQKRYVVRLTDQERKQMEKLVRSGKAHARKLLYGRILLKADADGPSRWTDERIAEAFEVSTATVARERRRFCEEGLEVALMTRKPARPRRRILDGRAEAHLVALSCSEPPERRERWSMRLLAEKMVEIGHVRVTVPSREFCTVRTLQTAHFPSSAFSGESFRTAFAPDSC